MGTEMAKVLKKGDKIIMICGPSEDNNVSYVERGFREAISEKGIVVADMTCIDNWKADLAGQYVAEHLEEIREVQGIMCGKWTWQERWSGYFPKTGWQEKSVWSDRMQIWRRARELLREHNI